MDLTQKQLLTFLLATVFYPLSLNVIFGHFFALIFELIFPFPVA